MSNGRKVVADIAYNNLPAVMIGQKVNTIALSHHRMKLEGLFLAVQPREATISSILFHRRFAFRVDLEAIVGVDRLL